MRLGSTSALLVVARHAHCIAALIKQLFPLPCQRRQVARRPPWESLYQLRYKSLTIRVKQGHNEQSQKPEKPRNARRTIYPTATTPPQPPHPTHPHPTPPHPTFTGGALPQKTRATAVLLQLLPGKNEPLHNMIARAPNAFETSVFSNSVAWNWWKHSFWGPIHLSFATWCVNPKKPLKLVCLTLAWLGPNENTAFATNKSYLRNMMCQLQKTFETSVFGNRVAWN